MAYYNGYSDEDDDQYGYDDYNDYGRGYYDDYDDRSDDYDNYYDDRDDYDPYDDHHYSEDDYSGDEDDDERDEATPRQHFEYAPEPSAAVIKQKILEIMKKNNVHPQDIPPEPKPHFPCELPSSLRFFNTKAFAWFSCPQRHNRWPSAHAWCYMDLKEQKICHRFLQKCKKCDKEASPEFPIESVERMANYAVRVYLKRMGEPVEQHNTSGAEPSTTEGKPHDEERCGKCQYLGRSCWK